MNDGVSVIIPAKGDSALLRRAIWSVTETADLPFELIVRPNAECVAANRNRGLSDARYDLVAFVDDDVLLPARWMSRLAACLVRHRDVGAVSGHLRFPDGSPQMRRVDLADGELWDVLIPGTCFVYSRRRVSDLRFDEGYVKTQWEDTDWMWRVRALGLRTIVLGGVHVVHDYQFTERPGLEANLERFRTKWGRLPSPEETPSILLEDWKAWVKPPLPGTGDRSRER